MANYPGITYPTAPAFPTGHEDVPSGPDLYTAVSSYIPAMVTDILTIIDQVGNIELGATKGIEFDSTVRINLAGGEIKVTAMQINTEFVVDTLSVGTLNITNDLIISNDLTVNGGANFAVTGTVTTDYVARDAHTLTQADEPGDPADNNAVFWVSSGVGFGDAGDFCCKITEGGGTTDFTISDYTAL